MVSKLLSSFLIFVVLLNLIIAAPLRKIRVKRQDADAEDGDAVADNLEDQKNGSGSQGDGPDFGAGPHSGLNSGSAAEPDSSENKENSDEADPHGSHGPRVPHGQHPSNLNEFNIKQNAKGNAEVSIRNTN